MLRDGRRFLVPLLHSKARFAKKNWVETVTDFVNTAVNSKTMQTINKAFAVADQVSGAVSAVTGKAYGTRKITGKTGRGSYI